MEIEYNLLPKSKNFKNNLEVKIDMYEYATELSNELDKLGIISRTQEVPQLGLVKVNKSLNKTRYDYIMLQMYFHQLVKKNLSAKLKLTYNNRVKATEFVEKFNYKKEQKLPTIFDVIQLLVISYNIGHFYNTFTSSRALSIFCNENEQFFQATLDSLNEDRFKSIFKSIIMKNDYHRTHLINTILILEKCDQNKNSVILTKEIIYQYLCSETLEKDSKLLYIFDLFKKVRNVSFIAFDLHISSTPILMDICNEKSMITFFEELLGNYNNNSFAVQLLNSITKLLDDNIYNENSNAICYYNISKNMVKDLYGYLKGADYYKLFEDRESILNKNYNKKYDFNKKEILKITFLEEEKMLSKKLIEIFNHMNNIKFGYYNRYSGETTILVAIKNKCQNKSKVAFSVMQKVVSVIRTSEAIKNSDIRYLIASKFFLYFYFDENPLVFNPTIDEEICVVCTRGSKQRVVEIDRLINNSKANKDTIHEGCVLKSYIEKDCKNDMSILIPSSIVVYDANKINDKLCEFDGLVIYPNRQEEQIIFIEAKNTKEKKNFSKKCLIEKFKKLNIIYDEEKIVIENHDAILGVTI